MQSIFDFVKGGSVIDSVGSDRMNGKYPLCSYSDSYRNRKRTVSMATGDAITRYSRRLLKGLICCILYRYR